MGFEHKIELADIGKLAFAAPGAGNGPLPDIGYKLVVFHLLHGDIGNALRL
ncbi:hypothetical protein SDC9_84076 [bioreactor metagenome]|uniref:Uncharacterized protein n=1 Tax=bioreactor metagenome TaxID=1076179 RepID=A0A644Z9U0_9ZZZZ